MKIDIENQQMIMSIFVIDEIKENGITKRNLKREKENKLNLTVKNKVS